MPDLRQERIYFANSQPILRVDNIPSLRFYVDLLGFENVDWGTDEFTSVSRDRAAIYLSKRDQGRGDAWVNDVKDCTRNSGRAEWESACLRPSALASSI